MRRREFITVLGGAAASSALVCPRAGRAQQAVIPVIGLLRTTPAAPFTALVAALRQGLGDEGFVEGRNVALEQRYADTQLDRLVRRTASMRAETSRCPTGLRCISPEEMTPCCRWWRPCRSSARWG